MEKDILVTSSSTSGIAGCVTPFYVRNSWDLATSLEVRVKHNSSKPAAISS